MLCQVLVGLTGNIRLCHYCHLPHEAMRKVTPVESRIQPKQAVIYVAQNLLMGAAMGFGIYAVWVAAHSILFGLGG